MVEAGGEVRCSEATGRAVPLQSSHFTSNNNNNNNNNNKTKKQSVGHFISLKRAG